MRLDYKRADWGLFQVNLETAIASNSHVMSEPLFIERNVEMLTEMIKLSECASIPPV